MIPLREVMGGLTGAWRLARFDPQGLSYFDTTMTGFWRSFFAALICAPAYLVMVALDLHQTPVLASDERLLAVNAIAYVISWTAFPLAMTWAARLLDREQYYLRYIIARNWAGVLEMTLFVPALLLAASDGSWFDTLPAFAAFVAFCYQWFVARTALATSGPQALAVVGLNLVIDLALMTAMQVLLPAIPMS